MSSDVDRGGLLGICPEQIRVACLNAGGIWKVGGYCLVESERMHRRFKSWWEWFRFVDGRRGCDPARAKQPIVPGLWR